MIFSRLFTLTGFLLTTLSILTLNASPVAGHYRLSTLTPFNPLSIGGVFDAFWWNRDFDWQWKDVWDELSAVEDKALSYAHDAFDDAAEEFKDASFKINEFRNLVGETVHTATDFRTTVLEENNVSAEQFSDEVSKAFQDVLDSLRKAFPSPDEAPGHEEREQMFREALSKMENGLVYASMKLGLPEKDVRLFWSKIEPALEKFLVISGDLIEQHPYIAETILLTSIALLLPEIQIMRPIVRVFGFQPKGVAAGSPAAWSQRFFYGAEVKAGSLFSKLQRVGSKPGSSIGFGSL